MSFGMIGIGTTGMGASASAIATARAGVARADVRLATGLRINRAADDPAGLIASEALGARAAELDASITASRRASLAADVLDGELASDGGNAVARAEIGAAQRGAERELRAAETERINTLRARSAIRDTDYARETSERARAGLMEAAAIRTAVIGRRAAAEGVGLLIGALVDVNG